MRLHLTTKFALSAVLMALGTRSLHAQPPAGRALTGALLGATAGALLGGLTGVFIGGNRCSESGNPDSCHAIDGMIVGAAVGVTLGTPVGAHLMNRRRGALPYSLLASAALAALGAVAFRAAHAHASGAQRATMQSAVVIMVPVLQIVTATVIETRSSRR